jgi:hypothetical protein
VECISAVPAPPRRRRKLPNVLDLGARLKRYETLLRAFGAQLDESGEFVGVPPNQEAAKLLSNQGSSNRPSHEVGNPGQLGPHENDPPEEEDIHGNEGGRLVVVQGKSRYIDK